MEQVQENTVRGSPYLVIFYAVEFLVTAFIDECASKKVLVQKLSMFLIITLWIRESRYFIIFHTVLNYICCGGPRNDFVISTIRFFPNKSTSFTICTLPKTLTELCAFKHEHRPMHPFLHPLLTSYLHTFETSGKSVHKGVI